jgi:hypothetical protein
VELAEPKGMDTLQAAREVQKCLDVYERALEKMEEGECAWVCNQMILTVMEVLA